MKMGFEEGLGPKIGDSKMNENQPKQENLLDTTDCLEAIGVFRGWKNCLLIIVICCLLLLQVSFWVVDLGIVKAYNENDVTTKALVPATAGKTTKPSDNTTTPKVALPEDVNKIQKAASQVVPEPTARQPVAAEPNVAPSKKPQETGLFSAIKFKHLAWVIRLLDFVLILSAILYCLTMLFSLMVSLLGRLGGINHISRAFFLSLLFLILLLPWQKLFGSAVKGAIYTPNELASWIQWSTAGTSGIFQAALYYLRFTGYWVLVMLLLVFSMLRSNRWTKATLHRLEVI